MNDEDILEEIKKLYAQPLTAENYQDVQHALTGLYSQLSYSRLYEPRELFPNLDETFKLTPEIEVAAQKIEDNANGIWSADGSGTGNDYFSCMEELEKITGQTFPRDYIYPNNLTSKEFQKSFNPTRMNRDISIAYHMMAFYGLANNTIGACSQMLFVEKNKAARDECLNKAYEDFWQINKDVDGFDYLKDISEIEKKRGFLMGVASEIPLADVEAYLKREYDGIQLPESETNAKKFDDIFHSPIPFTMTDTTWERFVEPAIQEKERKEKNMRGVTLELNPETGELEAVPVTEESNEEKGFGAKNDILLSRENDKQPQKKFNFETGESYYADERLQKIAELRKRLHTENNDPLAARQRLLENGLEEIGLSKDDLGKTGDSRSGEVSDKHKKVAESQTEDAKWSILQARQQRGG